MAVKSVHWGADRDGQPGRVGTPRLRAGAAQERRTAGTIAGKREGSLPAGRALIPLGSIEEGDYVMRVPVERVLVRNVAFIVEESD